MHRTRRHSDEGFSLVESVIACGVLAAGVLSVVQLLVLAGSMMLTSRQVTSASILAVQKLEDLRVADVPVSGSDRLDPSGAIVGDADGQRRIAYGRRWTVTGAGGDLIAISVAVFPYRRGEPDGENGSDGPGAVTLTTMRPERLP